MIRRAATVAATLAIAAGGGAGFAWLGLPAGWLAGGMVATAAACFAGFRANVPYLLVRASFVVLGLSIGSTVTKETLATMTAWPVSLACLAVTIAAVTAALQRYYQSAYRWDVRTSFFAALPGALGTVLALATAYRADLLRVTVVQCIRLFFLVAFLPLLITMLGTAEQMAPAPQAAVTDSLAELALSLAAGVAVGALFEWLKVPAGALLGAAVGNAALHLGDVAHGTLPGWILIPGYIVLGGLIGARFSGIGRAALIEYAGAGFKGFVLALVISAVGASLAAFLAGMPIAATLIAFAPGGLEAMAIMALALGLDPAFVGTHQLARFLGMSLVVPLVAAWIVRRGPAGKGEGGTSG